MKFKLCFPAQVLPGEGRVEAVERQVTSLLPLGIIAIPLALGCRENLWDFWVARSKSSQDAAQGSPFHTQSLLTPLRHHRATYSPWWLCHQHQTEVPSGGVWGRAGSNTTPAQAGEGPGAGQLPWMATDPSRGFRIPSLLSSSPL